MEAIGFIGLGIMGRPMAHNLRKAGYPLVVCDLNPAPVAELVAAGASEAPTPAAVAQRSDVIITMLPNSPEVRQVVLGPGGLIETVRPGTIVIDMSSIAPQVSVAVGAALAEKDAVLLDAPVSGGEPRAVDGTLSVMVGGPQEAFDAVGEILAVLGGSVVRVGQLGAGNTAKLANQIIVAINIAAMSEAMVLVRKAGVDPQAVYEAIRGGLAGSNVLEAKLPRVLEGDFAPGFRIDLQIKDLANAIAAAGDYDAPVPLTGQVMDILKALRADGKGDDDHGGIIQFYEKLAGAEVRK